jgi:alcohol dehydrogenase YqhD (iron-dependent ADH family)
MNNFELHNPTKIIFGTDAMDKIGANVKIYGKKVVITYGGGSIKKNGVYQKVISQLKDFDVEEFGGIEPNPRVETIREAVKKFKDFNPDFLLAVGGGSVIDGTKLLAAAMHYDGDPWDFMTKPGIEPAKYVPFGVVLTLSATGSEMNKGAVITNWTKHEKKFFGREQNYPAFSVIDPQNTFSLPKDQTAYGIIDAYSHVLEQYMTTTENVPLHDRFGEGIMLTLIENADKVLKNPTDYDARANISFCACMALNDLLRSGVDEDWATHGIEHQLSAFYDIPHAAGLAIITPRWMEVVKDQKAKKMVQYGKRIWNLDGSDDQIIKKAINATYKFFASLGVKMSLKEWDISDEYFSVMVERLVERGIGEIPLTASQIRKILDDCLEE